MSQSPEDKAGDTDRDGYLRAFGELANRIRNGASFSGRERNCSFSNRGDGTFTDVSGLTGFDFPEDGRGLALTDWDHDGDVDLWLSNRTGPRLKFLRNGIPSDDARWISFRLEGDPAKGVPRDAIGSRIELRLADGGVRMKSLHAGEAFLSQSSKWLHFGLGTDPEIAEVTVHWRQGIAEKFSGAEIRGRWHLKQGAGLAAHVEKRESVTLAETPLVLLPVTGVARIGLARPLKIPALVYRDLQDREQRVNPLAEENIILLNLWNDCEQCHRELKMFADSEKKITQAGIKIVALHAAHDPDRESSQELPKTLGFAGHFGSASTELVGLLDAAIAKSVCHHRGTPVPTSFLIDRGGWLSVIYKGPVELATLLEDAAKLGKGPEISRAAALPFEGKWAEKSFVSNPISNATAYLEGDYFEDARDVLAEFLSEYGSPPAKATDAETHARNRQQAEVYALLGEIERSAGAMPEAISNYEKSLKYNSRQVVVLDRLAWILATSPDPEIRDETKALLYAKFMMNAPKVPENARLLGTVAAAYASAGRFPEAIAMSEKAIALLGDSRNRGLLNVQEERLRRYRRGEALTE